MACACRRKLRPRGAYAGGETTLNAASTAAAQGTFAPIIAMGCLGAIVGDSAIFWIARRLSKRVRIPLDDVRALA